MAIETTANINIDVGWTYVDLDNPLTVVSDVGNVYIQYPLLNGSGSGQVNTVWHALVTLPSGGSTGLNLNALNQQLFNNNLLISFTGGALKAIVVKNTAEESGRVISLAATGTHGFKEPFNGGSGNVQIPSQSVLSLANPLYGWLVTSTSFRLQLLDTSGHGVTAHIALIGVGN
jgi:hypothetical protein